MKNLYIAVFLMIFSMLYSCIEEYDVSMQDPDNEILIVEGQIVGQSVCEFTLQRSFIDNEEYSHYYGPNIITYATVYVICSDGQVFGARVNNNGRYCVTMGPLDPDETYHLQIQIPNEGVYESEPMHPLPSTMLNQLSYSLSDDGSSVQIRLSNEDPQTETYYLWTYDEHWEINTPLSTIWEYKPQYDTIVRMEQKINRGWCSQSIHPLLVGSNLDYGNGALKDYQLYALSNLDNRFNTRYHTKVHQIAISKEEYEYYKQMEAQSAQSGGLFTLMPTQLPSNIRNEQGLRAEGYVGVHLNSSDAELYINGKDVGYKLTREIKIVPDSTVAWLGFLYNQDFRVYHYDQWLDASEWARTWCLDCRDPFWGAKLERPEFWQDQ